jgi:hypothetical protein
MSSFFLENPAQPEVFSSIGTCSWWAIETITSLGYGDIVPITAMGRAFSSLLALWCVVERRGFSLNVLLTLTRICATCCRGIILFTIPGTS